MSTELLSEMVESGAFAGKQEAERVYEQAQQNVERAKSMLDEARAQLVMAREVRKQARAEYDAEQRARRKPRQQNITRRIIEAAAQPVDRQGIISATGLDATTVSSTLTRLRKAGFVDRIGDEFVGKWQSTAAGAAFAVGDKPFPKV